jgi:hypothetical protein
LRRKGMLKSDSQISQLCCDSFTRKGAHMWEDKPG